MYRLEFLSIDRRIAHAATAANRQRHVSVSLRSAQQMPQPLGDYGIVFKGNG
jgi:hypothetical protein